MSSSRRRLTFIVGTSLLAAPTIGAAGCTSDSGSNRDEAGPSALAQNNAARPEPGTVRVNPIPTEPVPSEPEPARVNPIPTEPVPSEPE
ncbi:MAG: hypothetical protein AAGF11_31500, partial [Myxococcota bacterium]